MSGHIEYRDKDARAVLRPLLPLAAEIWATQTVDNPRALPAAVEAGLQHHDPRIVPGGASISGRKGVGMSKESI